MVVNDGKITLIDPTVRTSQDSSSFNVGKSIKEAVRIHNESLKPDQKNKYTLTFGKRTTMSFSRAVMKSVEDLLKSSSVFQTHYRKKTARAIAKIEGEDYSKELQDVIERLHTKHPLLSFAGGDWAARKTIIQKLQNECARRKVEKKERNERKGKNKKKETSKRGTKKDNDKYDAESAGDEKDDCDAAAKKSLENREGKLRSKFSSRKQREGDESMNNSDTTKNMEKKRRRDDPKDSNRRKQQKMKVTTNSNDENGGHDTSDDEGSDGNTSESDDEKGSGSAGEEADTSRHATYQSSKSQGNAAKATKKKGSPTARSNNDEDPINPATQRSGKGGRSRGLKSHKMLSKSKPKQLPIMQFSDDDEEQITPSKPKERETVRSEEFEAQEGDEEEDDAMKFEEEEGECKVADCALKSKATHK